MKISVDAFMEKSHWFDLEDGQYIRELVAHYNDERRIYVATVEPDPLTRQIHDR